MNSGSASKSLELLEKTYGLPMTNQYKNWLDSLRSRISQCLEQIEFLKLIDEAVALLTEARTQPTGILNSTGPVIEILLQLIDQMVVPGDFTQQAEILRSRLSEELTQETLSQIRSDIIELAPAFDKRMALEWTRWKRYGAWLSLIIMEVDQFEHINATLGHYSGDKVLKAMVVVLMRKLRATDFLARYGGGKFALLLPETSCSRRCPCGP
jgi:GGDEF domain-containing protein